MCKYCAQVTHQNFAGKRFFTPLPSNFGGDTICLSINTYDRYAVHYENVHKPVSDVVSAYINFCPMCGRKLTETDESEDTERKLQDYHLKRK